MLGTLDSAQVEELLHTEVVGRLGCISARGPYVVPVCYVYRGGFVYGHSMDGMKWQSMQAHPDVCFEVEHVDDLTNWRSVIGWGRFEALAGPTAEHGMAMLIERLMPLLGIDDTQRPPDHGEGHRAGVFRIHLTETTGRFEAADARRGPTSATPRDLGRYRDEDQANSVGSGRKTTR